MKIGLEIFLVKYHWRLCQLEATAAMRQNCKEVSLGKNTMTGHWEIMGLNITEQLLSGMDSQKLLQRFEEFSRRRLSVKPNKPYSGTCGHRWLGPRQMIKLSQVIIYTSTNPISWKLQLTKTLFLWMNSTVSVNMLVLSLCPALRTDHLPALYLGNLETSHVQPTVVT